MLPTAKSFVSPLENSVSLRKRATRLYAEGWIGIRRRDSMLRHADVREKIEQQLGENPAIAARREPDMVIELQRGIRRRVHRRAQGKFARSL